jgi:hypothetical protein
MAPPTVPGIPGSRLPMASEDQGDEFERALKAAQQAERVALAVEEKLAGRLGKLEGSVMAVDQRLADIELWLKRGKAFAASTTVKILLGMLGSGGFAGFIVKLTTPAPVPAQTIIQRSAFDRELDVCRELRDGAERGACIGRIAAENAAVGPGAK